METLRRAAEAYEWAWEQRDTRVDSFVMMQSVLPTLVLCLGYFYIVKVWGPRYMRDRPPFQIRSFIIVYNVFQILLNAWLFIGIAQHWFGGKYNWFCQPVDYSNSEDALHIMYVGYAYYLSKFIDFIDTFCFVARKKFKNISLLHVVHHGLVPLSCWPGARWFCGGHATFFTMLNSFVHVVMYTYYMIAAMGPEFQKYIWWKKYLTRMQMVQFVAFALHGVQLLFYDSCGFPWQFAYYIAMHGVLFLILFAHFYINAYMDKKTRLKRE